MKKVYFSLVSIAVFTFVFVSCDDSADISESVQSMNDSTLKEVNGKNNKATEKCTTIQSGEIMDKEGEIIKVGYDNFGYNYQAQIYSGVFYPDTDPDWYLVMKWNDAWLSKQDCDGDGMLDSRYGYDTYRGSGAWVTYKWTTTYVDSDENECKYYEFYKVIAVPVDAYLKNDYWYNTNETEIGKKIFSDFAIVQYIVNDPCNGISGVQYKSPDHPGLGNW